MATVSQQIQQVYLGLLGRAADQSGLDYWTNEIDSGSLTLEQLRANIVNEQPEYAEGLGTMTRAQVVASLYENLFDRAPDSEGLDYWVNGGGSTVNADQLVLALVNGAAASDTLALDNKVEVAQYYTAQAGDGFSVDAAAAAVADVDGSLQSVQEAKSAIDSGNVSSGDTFTLTQGLDTLTGTANDDTFNAYAFNGVSGADVTTLNSVDTINGGTGRDTLNIEVKADGGTEDFNGTVQGTIKNVEVININNAQANTAADVDASDFEGAEEIWQVGAAGKVTELGADTTAGFRNITTGTLSVTAADAAAAASVVLDGVGEAATLNVLGSATGSLNSVNVSGSRVDSNSDDEITSLTLGVTAGKDQETVSVDSAFDTTLAVTDGAGKTVKTVDASASEGDIAYTTAANTVSTIKTGAGDDTVNIATATSNVTGSVVNALVESGEGDDKINVNTTGTGKTTINAGSGDDTITLTSALATSTRIDGGAGTDKVVLPNGGDLVAGDYALIGSTVSNVESLEFGATVTADASKLSQFSELTFDAAQAAASVIDNVAADQTLVAKGDLTAEAAGYQTSAENGGNGVVYAGTLNVVAQAAATPTAQAIDVSAETANVTVAAASGNTATPASSQAAANIATITGDVQSLNVVTANGVDNADLDADAAADTLSVVNITVGSELVGLTELTLSGNGTAVVDNANSGTATKLATIDASELGGELAYGANAGDITGGLDYTGNSAVAESVTLGSGSDVVTANSTYGKMDVITGFDSTKETNDGTSVTDQLIFAGMDTASATATKVTLSEDATSLELAFVEAAAASGSTTADSAGSVVTFQFEGNTYLFQDAAGSVGDASDQGTLEDGDLAIEVVGLHDFSKDFDAFVAA